MNARLGQRTSLLLGQLVLVLAVLTAGVLCAVSPPWSSAATGVTGAQARTLVAQAASRITTVGSYQSRFEFAISIQGKTIKTSGSGLSDVNNKTASGTFDIPGFGSIEFRQLGDRGYIRLPGGRVDALGHHWLSVVGASSASVGGQDPLTFLRALSADDTVDNKGPEKVAGVATVHYTVRLDAHRLIAAAQSQGSLTTPVPDGIANQFRDATVDLWLDGQNLPRRMRMSYGTDQVSFRFQFEFADYGGTIKIPSPPESDVTPAATMQQAMLQLQTALRG